MSVNNDVYQMLVGAWAGGQNLNYLDTNSHKIIACNYDTNLAATLGTDKRFYLAVKNDENDVTFSPQFCIETNRIKAISAMPFYGGQTEIQYLKGFMPDVTEKEIELGKILQIFGIKVQAENKKLMKILGLGAYTKTVFSDKVCFDMSDPSTWDNATLKALTTTCFYAEDANNNVVLKTGTDLVDGYKLYKKYAALITLYNAINKNEDDYFTAYFATDITPGTGCNAATKSEFNIKKTNQSGDEDIESFHEMVENLAQQEIDENLTEVFLCIESKPIAKKNFCSINMHYYKDRFTSLKVSLVEGFCCGAEMVVAQEPHSSNGEGYDVRYREYRAGGWNGKPGPYRTYAVTGLAKEEISYQADVDGEYDLFSITYEISRIAGWLDHRSWVTVEFAVPHGASCDNFEALYNGSTGALDLLASAAGITVQANTCCACGD